MKVLIYNFLGDTSDELEDDSILTQVVNSVEEEADLDMTLPLEQNTEKIEHNIDFNFDITLIPQLDGENDDCEYVSSFLVLLQSLRIVLH